MIHCLVLTCFHSHVCPTSDVAPAKTHEILGMINDAIRAPVRAIQVLRDIQIGELRHDRVTTQFLNKTGSSAFFVD